MPMDKSTFANKKNLNRLLDLVDQQINILDLKICEQEIINNNYKLTSYSQALFLDCNGNVILLN